MKNNAGKITTKSGIYVFLLPEYHGFDKIWAWNVHDDLGPAGRIMCHKWDKLPKGLVEWFDIDRPPETVKWNPLIEPEIDGK